MAEPLRATREAPLVRQAPPVYEQPRSVRPTKWDVLLVCVAVYVASSIGRVHQLFPLLSLVRPALLATVLAIGLYLLQQYGQRRIGRLNSSTITCLVGLVAWGALSVPFALNQ